MVFLETILLEVSYFLASYFLCSCVDVFTSGDQFLFLYAVAVHRKDFLIQKEEECQLSGLTVVLHEPRSINSE